LASTACCSEAAGPGRNPQTGKEIKISAKKVVKFKAGAELAGSINKGK
jgi:DNA-binding protein HU-beta